MRCKKIVFFATTAVIILVAFILNKKSLEPSTYEKKQKKYSTLIVSDIEYRISAIPDVSVIKFDSLSIRKRKIGSFTLGAWNELFIENLNITLIDSEKNDVSSSVTHTLSLSETLSIIKEETNFMITKKFSYARASPIKIYNFLNSPKLKMHADEVYGLNENTLEFKNIKFYRSDNSTISFKKAKLRLDDNKLIVNDKTYDFNKFIF